MRQPDFSQAWYFFANFHKIYPIEKSFGVTLTCLCNNHIFEVKPKTSWARIVQVRTYGEFRDKILDLRHDVVGLTKQELSERRLHGHLEADDANDTATSEVKSPSSPGQINRPASGRSQ